ncbi:hypothetical protein ACSVH2_02815 [Flavobacterium sp. RSB2_4_14]|uniref:hypothetical protein n=1 Tax=Flavobacterium sp. RSB2_4_14 TaxID=3447665 RepID=UPI003F3147F1
MDFLEGLDSFYLKIGLLIIFFIGYLIIQRKKDLKFTLQYLLLSYGIGILLISTSIIHIFPGYPYEISDLENKKRLLYHLQKNNEALAQMTEAFRDMAFLTFIMFTTIISKIIKHFKIDDSVE